ncbi:MAG: hypothetical protein EOM40_11435 [Clostridia bacterium]|nr:hypothetical protein [Clostridia bacterium]NCC42909.1 hypothetical protein [Clostridia bacterium]
MKKMKKVITLLLSTVMLVMAFAGCGTAFNASEYLKAILDNSYKHDSTAFLEQKIGSKEEAEQLFQDGIDSNMDAMLASFEMSEELKPEFEDLFAQIYAKADYTVGEAAKQEDDSYIVSVTYKPMNLFEDATASFQEEVNNLTNTYSEKAANGEEIPDDAALQEEIIVLYKDCILNTLSEVTYGEEASMDIRIELNDKVYTPNTDDLASLENALLAVA